MVSLPKKRTNYSFGVMYDFIQLEVEEEDHTGIRSAEVELKVEVYPNPAKDVLYIELPDNQSAGELRLINTVGQTILSESLSENKNKIVLQDLPHGIYVAVTEAKGLFYKNKLLIQ